LQKVVAIKTNKWYNDSMKIKRWVIFLFVLFNVNNVYSLTSDANIDWRIIASSKEIIIANTNEIKNIDRTVLNKYYEYNILVNNILKGISEGRKIFKIYMNDENYKYIESLEYDKEVIIFLISTYDGYGNNNYLAEYSIEDTIILNTELNKNTIKDEIISQKNIIQNKLYENFTIIRKDYNMVRKTINNITNIILEKHSFTKLEKMDMEGVPYIILLMENYKKIPSGSISLKNKSENAFEEFRHYGPELVIDALAAILNQITGEDFGFIYNGESTQEERELTLNGWRIYLYYLKNGNA
jgi:hypothetical protein